MSWFHNLKKGDLVIIAIVLLLAALVFAPFALAPSQSLTCEITQDDETIRRVRLGAGYQETITIEGDSVTNVIQIEDDCVYFASSDCPDQVCVRTGKLTRAGQIAVCLPNRVVVRLVGAQDEVDAVVR
ncbi:MAG: NusG domain II-containing protein [Butyricicoccus sp.]|nr:NusG domain II-containing protein [Butyricicoccus sp.]